MHRIGDRWVKNDIFGVGFELFGSLGAGNWAQVPSSLGPWRGLAIVRQLSRPNESQHWLDQFGGTKPDQSPGQAILWCEPPMGGGYVAHSDGAQGLLRDIFRRALGV